MFLRPGALDEDSDDDNVASPLAAYAATRPSTASSRPLPVETEFYDRPSTASSSASSFPDTSSDAARAGTVTTPAARAEKMRQQKLLQQQRMKQRAGAAPSCVASETTVIMQKDDHLENDLASSGVASSVAASSAHTPSGASRPMSASLATHNPAFSFSPQTAARSSYSSASTSASSASVFGASGAASSSSSYSSAALGSPKAGASEPPLDDGLRDLMREREAEQEAKQLSSVEKEMQLHGVSPVFDPVRRQAAASARLDFSDMRTFCWNAPPAKTNVECYITRRIDGDGATKSNPVYELYTTKDDRFLLAAVKRTKNRTSNYAISLNRAQFDKTSTSFLGKLRSNFVGTEFVVYDKGINPNDAPESPSADASSVAVRQELATVIYQSNILVSRGPRKMTVLLPTVRADGSRTVFRPMNERDTMLAKYEAEPDRFGGGHVLQNKAPKWNENVGAYVLNFNGRVKLASVKNFQLVDRREPETIVLQFGKTDKDRFNMDYQHPMSAFQAFAICLSAFDYKLACE